MNRGDGFRIRCEKSRIQDQSARRLNKICSWEGQGHLKDARMSRDLGQGRASGINEVNLPEIVTAEGIWNLVRPPSLVRQEPQWSDGDTNLPTKISA